MRGMDDPPKTTQQAIDDLRVALHKLFCAIVECASRHTRILWALLVVYAVVLAVIVLKGW